MKQTLSLDSLGDLDNGAARLMIDRALAAAVADLDDRGDDGKARKVVITLELKRTEGGLVVSHVQAKAAVPVYRTAGTLGKLRQKKGGQAALDFQQHAADDPDQRTIDEAINRKEQ